MFTLIILLDSNEYIFGLTKLQGFSAKLLEELPNLAVKLPRFILNELHGNLPAETLKILYQMFNEAKIEIKVLSAQSFLKQHFP